MKSKFIFPLTILLLLVGVSTSCKPDKETAPVVEDVLATYANATLVATVDGQSAPTNARVEVVKVADKSVSIRLYNFFQGVHTFTIPKATFEAMAKSAFLSRLAGEASSYALGYHVRFSGTIDEGVLTAAVTFSEIEGDSINTKECGLYSNIYKGEMQILSPAAQTPFKMVQRVYTSRSADKDSSKLKLQIQRFAFGDIALGTINLDSVLLLNRGLLNDVPVYSFSVSERVLTLPAPIGTILVDANGTVIGDKIEMDMVVHITQMGMMDVEVNFQGVVTEESSSTNDVFLEVNSPLVNDSISYDSEERIFTCRIWESPNPTDFMLAPKFIASTSTLDSIVRFNSDDEAIIKVDSGAAVDFLSFKNGDYLRYYVTAQDIRYSGVRDFKIEILRDSSVYDMSTWVEDPSNLMPTPKGLTNSNFAAVFFPAFDIIVPTPVAQGSDGAAEITTSVTVSPTNPGTLVPGVTAGTLFVGAFQLDFSNTLKSTRFGKPYRKEPQTFKVSYKYQPGDKFYKTAVKDSGKGPYNTAELVPGIQDTATIIAYLYEVNNYNEHLDGTNINSSDKVVLRSRIVVTDPLASYNDVEIPFQAMNGKTYDPSKKYKLAIVCSSSMYGDQFMGANGSKLTVKHLEVVPK